MARSRRVRRGGFSGFYLLVGAIVVAGSVLVGFSRKANDAGAVGPYLAGDSTPHAKKDEHWHAAVAINVCGVWQPNPQWPTSDMTRKGSQLQAGLHTHGDGIVHMEPASPDEAGKNATVGTWLKWAGWKASSTSVSLWSGADGQQIKLANGDTCTTGKYKGRKAELRWALGRNQAGKTTKFAVRSGSVSKYKLYDRDVVAVYFLPPNVKLGGGLLKVPAEANLDTSSETTTSTTVPVSTPTTGGSSSTTGSGGSTTTAPSSGSPSSTGTPSSTATPSSSSPATTGAATTVP